MTNMTKIEEFKKELRALLIKYNASIDVDVQGDTHCIQVSTEITIYDENKKFKYTSYPIGDYSIEPNDLV